MRNTLLLKIMANLVATRQRRPAKNTPDFPPRAPRESELISRNLGIRIAEIKNQ